MDLIRSIGTLQILLQSGTRMKNIREITWHPIAQKSKWVKCQRRARDSQSRMTGYTFHPHLHFQVFIFTRANIWMDFDTVSVQDFIS